MTGNYCSKRRSCFKLVAPAVDPTFGLCLGRRRDRLEETRMHQPSNLFTIGLTEFGKVPVDTPAAFLALVAKARSPGRGRVRKRGDHRHQVRGPRSQCSTQTFAQRPGLKRFLVVRSPNAAPFGEPRHPDHHDGIGCSEGESPGHPPEALRLRRQRGHFGLHLKPDIAVFAKRADDAFGHRVLNSVGMPSRRRSADGLTVASAASVPTRPRGSSNFSPSAAVFFQGAISNTITVPQVVSTTCAIATEPE
jgi:hypothetical protein